MDSTDDEDHSNARWFYRRCSAARISMETPLSTLELSLRVLRFVESIVVDVDGEEEEEEEDDCDDRASSSSQLRLFDELRDGCKARRRDLSFVYDVCDRALDLRDDGEFTEAALRAVAKEAEEAVARDGGGCIGLESREIGDDAVAAAAAAAAPPSSAPSRSARGGGSSSARADDNDDDDHQRGEQHVDIDGLRCFQLRTRVFGLSLPTFTTELWRYLQLAGWTHSHYTGKYHIPKRIKERRYNDSEDMAKKMYKHFNLDDGHARGRNGTAHPSSGDGEGADDADEEEGPEIFDSSNELVDYLDEYCMPDYRATMAEVEAARVALSAHTSAYRRRNLRLRLDLLEVVHRERLRKSLARREEESRSKYGHSHRPCEVCFRGANPVYPRVACRDCGLVVHTNCYGLTDHAEKKGGDGNGAEVDEKGYFTCDVCAIECVFPRKIGRKQLYHASQRSGWRVHQHPDAACPLCGWNHITGGMVRIAADDSDAAVPSDAKSRKRKSRRSEDSESWVHLFCMNALPFKKKVSPGSVRSGGDATVHIRNLLNESSEMVREVDSMRTSTIKCETCARGKGDLVQCEGSCGRFYHRLCLQIDCLDVVGWDAKKEHLCPRCRNVGGGAHPDPSAPFPPDGTSKVDCSQIKSSKATVDNPQVKSSKGEKSAEEVDQYFGRKSGKTSKTDGARNDLVVPSQQECITEVEILHRECNVDIEFDKFEVQYQKQFDEWSFLLATSQSILLYGFGSKVSVLTKFGDFLAQEGDVMSLNGYDPNINMSVFLDCMDDLFSDGRDSHRSDPHARDSNKGLAKKAASIAKRIAATRSRPLFLLIHNIDGLGLRNPVAQNSIATLTASSNKNGLPLIRVVASVDNVNAALVLWSPEVEQKFDWAWKMVHTHRPYFEEVRSMPQAVSSKKVKRKNGSQIIGGDSVALKVLACLAPRHTEVLQALATLQHSTASKAVSYGMLRDECTRKMLPSSDTVLRNILKELSDHRIVALERGEMGNEMVCVPSEILRDILNFKLS